MASRPLSVIAAVRQPEDTEVPDNMVVRTFADVICLVAGGPAVPSVGRPLGPRLLLSF